MNNKNKTTVTTSGGVGFLELLQIVFIVLKLIGTIDWSWWWVLSPTLIPLGLLGIVLIVGGIYVLVSKD